MRQFVLYDVDVSWDSSKERKYNLNTKKGIKEYVLNEVYPNASKVDVINIVGPGGGWPNCDVYYNKLSDAYIDLMRISKALNVPIEDLLDSLNVY